MKTIWVIALLSSFFFTACGTAPAQRNYIMGSSSADQGTTIVAQQ